MTKLTMCTSAPRKYFAITCEGYGVSAAAGDEGDATAAARGEKKRMREVVVL